MEAKKISFGFSKITKKLNLLPSKEIAKTESKVELIKCLEGQEIKLVQEKPDEQPLIIPLKESHKTSAALASLIKRRAVLLGEEEPEDNTAASETKESTNASNNDVPEDIEKRAARELLAEIQNNDSTNPANNLVLPVVKPEDLPLEGAKESNLDDYDSIPIQDFGKAMLRGMGWTEPPPKTNKKGGPPIDDTPMVRPKGMGLGADKALSKKPLLVAPESNEVLEVKRNAYVRVLGGKHKDLYGQIEGFDDHAGRVIVKMAIGGAKEAFNEFLCQPVSRKEYAQYGKCINSTKYEEYKKKENEHGQIILNKDEKDLIDQNSREQKKPKKERKYSEEEDYKYQKSNGNYEKNMKNKDYRDDKKDIKKESYNYKDESYNNGNDRNRNENKDRKRETNRDDDRDQRRENNNIDKKDRREYSRDDGRDQKREYHRDDDRVHRREYNKDNERDRQRDHNRYETTSYRKHDNDDKRHYKDSRSDNPNSQKSLEHSTSHRGNRDGDLSCNRERQRDRNRDQDNVIDLNDSSDSESDSHSYKHKKAKKSKHAKKKSKKSKSKYKSDSSSDTETSSTDSSSDSEAEKHKKHRKKTKKSKKQRERSRSRGRRFS